MGSIQNDDVKSVEELESQGGQKSDLTHDTKIYVTAKGLKKTLAEIIESGEIADGNRFGADVKNFCYCMADGSSEEHNVEVPYVNAGGNTQLDLTFEISDYEVAQLYYDGVYYTKYVSEAVTPDKWWNIVGDNSIEIQGDITEEAKSISFIVYRGSEIPVVPSVFSGLKKEYEAFGYTNSSSGDNIKDIYSNDIYTIIEFTFDMLQQDVPFVYVDGELYPEWTASNNTGRWYKKLSSNTIQLGTDLTGESIPFYVSVFQGKSFIDSYGNMVVTLKPEIASFILQNELGDKWNIACSVEGELIADSIVTSDPADRILFRNDGNVIVELKITDDGQFYVEEQSEAGILFEAIYLSDIDGLVWDMGATVDNVLYTESHAKNKFCILRPNGKVLKQFSAQVGNSCLEHTGYVEEEDLVDVVDEPNQTATTSMVRKDDGTFSLFRWDTLKKKWEDFLLQASVPVGGGLDWWGLPEEIPSNFMILDGQWLLVSTYPTLFNRIGYSHGSKENGKYFRLPKPEGRVIRAVGAEENYGKAISDRTRRENATDGTLAGTLQEGDGYYNSYTFVQFTSSRPGSFTVDTDDEGYPSYMNYARVMTGEESRGSPDNVLNFRYQWKSGKTNGEWVAPNIAVYKLIKVK